ncbi:ADAMTS-like protein 1 [Nymphon striatum]|nr:ADAMTS-like protein 1 [Nymphon striatum]
MFFVYKLERGLIRRHFSVIKTKGIENKIKMLNYDFINFNSSVWWPEPVKYPFHGNGYFTSSYHHYHENDILPVPATLPHFVERLSYLNEIFSDPVKYPFHGNGYFTDHIRLIKYQRNVAGTGKIDTAFTLFTPKSRRDLPHDVRAGMDIHPLFDRLNFKCIENHGDVCIRYDWELLIREKITPRELFSSIPTLQSTKRQSRLFNVLKASLLNLRPPLTFYHILNLMYIYIYIYPHNMGVFGFYKSHIKWEFIFLIIFWMNIIPKSYIYLDLLISFENEKAADIFGLRNLLTVKYLLLNGTIFTRIIIICSINQCYKRPLRSYLFCFLQGGDGFTNFGGWSSWTEWSSCSRSCDGGASSMTRKCLFNKGCRYGKLTRYRICNMQPCNDAKNFRDVQCSEYDNKLYNGQFHKWSVAPYNPLRPCALSCSSNRTSVVVEFASQVHDGTRCREGSLGMCISGSCMPVGCDLQLDSTKKIDECGVCGGDGSSCHQSSYHWYETGLSECSVSCGGVEDLKFTGILQNEPDYVTAPSGFLVPKFFSNTISVYGKLKVGVSVLQVVMGEHSGEQCTVLKEEKTCSVSCGSGYRTRSVYCKDADGLQNQSCDMTQKPAKRQRCVLTHICSPAQHRKLGNLDERDSILLMGFVAGEWGECSSSNTCGWGFRQRQVRCKVYVEFSGEVILSDDDCSDSVKPLGKDKCFLRPCDDYISNTLDGSTCIFYAYTGVRESITECIRTKDDAVVSPTNCDLSTKPDQLIQTCNNRPCPPRWNISDFTPCTKNCGGGKQFRTVHCIHEVTRGNVLSVSNKLCPQPPPRLERLCGVISCPIKWKTGQWSQRMLMITVKKKKGIKYSSAHSKEQPFCFLIMLAKSLLNIIY